MNVLQTILVVDDDADIASSVELVLDDAGYAVVLAENGVEALQCIRQREVHLILLDMKMPLMDGWAFITAYRTQFGHRVPIVMMSATHDIQAQAQATDVEGALAKPFEIEQLIEIVERFVA